MNLATILGLLLLGLIAGAVSSIVGIGGGVVIVPVLVFLFAFSQKMAQGTSLALLLPPIGLFAVMNYYKAGFVDLKVALVLGIAFLVGSYFGSKLALTLPENVLKKVFGFFLLAISLKYILAGK
jgi:uncharacterized protein